MILLFLKYITFGTEEERFIFRGIQTDLKMTKEYFNLPHFVGNIHLRQWYYICYNPSSSVCLEFGDGSIYTCWDTEPLPWKFLLGTKKTWIPGIWNERLRNLTFHQLRNPPRSGFKKNIYQWLKCAASTVQPSLACIKKGNSAYPAHV